ncbi:adenine nucleotide alpha hydrolases-like protein [Anaeromyces robustus]|jgi:nucleotide-binding universal stress UspA family protein|uniref:Adenine nucleotide alpha hydrolases-like protein n=1 Tax=Anaeromyces robustus TaxID=1754192 RepID=A0A1Y1WR09_9FUNG|nr:adenine nucleotide alpha hydrolases-like protein [Anaeromyces robustus]|eukprot:ORX75973.1 adenine nucleotide alpha hydrolases-like protein [Anaeromyces robustus]
MESTSNGKEIELVPNKRKILFGTDFSKCTAKALEYAFEHILRSEDKLIMMAVGKRSWTNTADYFSLSGISPISVNNVLQGTRWQNQESSLKQEEINTKERALENMEELVRVALKKCSCPKTIDCVFEYAWGDPGQILCEMASKKKVDMMILGANGKTYMQGLILGSVSNYCLSHCNVPVIVIRQPL